MNRRAFLKSLISTAVIASVPVNIDKFLISSMSLDDAQFIDRAHWIYGIPYHYSNASTGEWLGFSRAKE